MRKICSSGSVGERGGNEPLYPENMLKNGKEEIPHYIYNDVFNNSF